MLLDYTERQRVNRYLVLAISHERARAHTETSDLLDQLIVEKNKAREDLAVKERELEAMKDELAFLREYFNAHVEHAIAKQEVLDVHRRHTIERAMEAQRDPAAPLQ
jgi:hypothetical protein